VDSFPDWSVFQEREAIVPTSELLSPASEIATTLRATHLKLVVAQQTLQDLEQSSFAELAQQAVLVVQMGMLLERSADAFLASSEKKPISPIVRIYKSLQIIQKQMLDELKKAGLEIEVPLHKTYAEVADTVEIEHWRHSQDIAEEIVIDVLEPVIRRGALLRAGRVIMGAPLSAQTFAGRTETITSEQTQQETRKDNQADE
jgi:hypothetical protein